MRGWLPLAIVGIACQSTGVSEAPVSVHRPSEAPAEHQDIPVVADTPKRSPTANSEAPDAKKDDPMSMSKEIPAGMQTFRATVEIDAKPGGKRLQAVWLVHENGERWVIDYRAREFWKPFEGTTVDAAGKVYAPQGQAIGATHFRVHSLGLDPNTDSSAPWTWIGPESQAHGKFHLKQGAPGSKSADTSWPVFVSEEGRSYQLANAVELDGLLGVPVTIEARPIERSPFVAHMPGPTLFVMSVETLK